MDEGHVDTKKVKDISIPKNNQAKKNLETAKDQLSEVVKDIPVDFTYTKQFQVIPNAINPIIDQIKSLNGIIEGKVGSIEQANNITISSDNQWGNFLIEFLKTNFDENIDWNRYNQNNNTVDVKDISEFIKEMNSKNLDEKERKEKVLNYLSNSLGIVLDKDNISHIYIRKK